VIVLLVVGSFLIGSIPTGLLIARARGIDLRKVGSGNIGATNVLRVAGKQAALLTLIGDIAKGIIPVALARAVGFAEHHVVYEGLCGLAAIIGHDFSPFLRFKGGKGVATSIGVLLVFSPHVGLFTIMLWLMTAKWTRYSSLSALISFGLLPLSVYMIDYSKDKMMIALAITVLLFMRHTGNIRRLVQGTETKIGEKTRVAE
jgi:glycerol-3-phosphate acyltransferase PlsY